MASIPRPDATSPSHAAQEHLDAAAQPFPDAKMKGAHTGDANDDIDFAYFDPSGVEDLRRTMSRGEATTDDDDKTVTDRFDFEKTLRDILQAHDDNDIARRELGVVFEDLRVTGVGGSASFQPTLDSVLNPINALKGIHSLLRPATRDILSGFEGVVRPGEMLLVLGRPGSGCTTLLKVLANQRQGYHSISGDIAYDSLTPDQIERAYRGDVQYCPEDDVHFPTLTVHQTLSLAARLRTSRARVDDKSRDFYVDRLTEVIETVFGLRAIKDTLVGDASIRGVSGGEKKRVSIGEVLATRSLLNSWDNATRGLDASTALEFVHALRIATNLARHSTIVAIYQVGEPLYRLFDKVCVIYEGKMAYFGPADRAREYFIEMGYEPAPRQTTADFLVSVTDPHGRVVRSGFESRAPRNAIEFAGYYQRHAIADINRQDIAAYKDEFVGKAHRTTAYVTSAEAERAKYALPKSPYIVSIPMQARALMRRRWQIILGNPWPQLVQLAAFVLQAIIIGTVFLRLKNTTASFFPKGGVLFFSLLFAALSTMPEITSLFSQRPIVHRQSRAAMYHRFVDSLALTLVDVPITFGTIVAFAVTIYFLVGLQESAAQFFIFLLFVFTVTLLMKGLFRLVAAACKGPAPAQAIAGLATLVFTLYTGYLIPAPTMVKGLKWLTWVNPLRYGFEGMFVNEFRTVDAECVLIPQGGPYDSVDLANRACVSVGSVPGSRTVQGLAFAKLAYQYEYGNLWRNFGVMCVFLVGFIMLLLLFSEINTGLAGETNVVFFKRGSKVDVPESREASDEEKVASNAASAVGDSHNGEAAMDIRPTKQEVFSFQHIEYTIPVGQGQARRLLDDVSGYATPGKLTALMGESGAGKTTLLNVLAERTDVGVVRGNRFLNGQRLPSDFQAHTGYCQQMDTHLPTASVREALMFSAKMRQPQSVSTEEKAEYVEKVLKMCGLAPFADAIVGSLGVEHRKRTTIAVELVAKPSLIFLDEPTSGLDSQSALAITTFLRELADSGQAIVCTIHQPSAGLLQIFDRLLLLRKGGQTVYFGDIGPQSSTLIDYFQRNGGRRCQDDENPAEYILDVIGAGATATSKTDWHRAWSQSAEAEKLQHVLESIHEEGRRAPAIQATQRGDFSTSWTYQLVALLQREAQFHWRDPTYLLAKFGLNIVAALLIGFTYFKSNLTLQGAQNQLFSIFISTVVSVAIGHQMQVPFIDMRNIYEIRERHSKMYRWSALITAQVAVGIFWNIIGSSLYFLCWYWTVGFPNDRAGFTYLVIGVLFPLYYTTIAQAVGVIAPSAEIGAMLFTFLFVFVVIFDGVMQPFNQLGWWKWMYHLSPYTYVTEALLGQAVGNQEIVCSPVEFVGIVPPSGQTCMQYLGPFMSFAGGYLADPDATSLCQYCAYRTTDAFLAQSFNIYYSHRWRNVGIVAGFIVFNTVALYGLMYVVRVRTGKLDGLRTVVSSIFRRR